MGDVDDTRGAAGNESGERVADGTTRAEDDTGNPGDGSGTPETTRRGLLAAGCAAALGGFGAFESLLGGPDEGDDANGGDARGQATDTTLFGNDTENFFNGTTNWVQPNDPNDSIYTTFFGNDTTYFFGTETTDFLRTRGRWRRRRRRRRRRQRRFRTYTTDFRGGRRRRRYRTDSTVTFDDGFEPSADPSGAEVLGPPVTFSGRIVPSYDVDYFQFFARRGEQVVLEPLTVTGPLMWSFFGPNLGLLSFSLRRIRVLVQNTGYQYLRIESRGNQIGRYAFRLWVRG